MPRQIVYRCEPCKAQEWTLDPPATKRQQQKQPQKKDEWRLHYLDEGRTIRIRQRHVISMTATDCRFDALAMPCARSLVAAPT
jgi:hypothetical protein